MTTLLAATLKVSSLLLGAALLCTSAQAADKPGPPKGDVRYERERAACLNGSSNQDRATCLREADAAHAEVQRGALNEDKSQFDQNARKRCEALPDGDRQACFARMQGQGNTSGSAAAGGILRENVTREPAAPAAPASAVPAQAEPAKPQ